MPLGGGHDDLAVPVAIEVGNARAAGQRARGGEREAHLGAQEGEGDRGERGPREIVVLEAYAPRVRRRFRREAQRGQESPQEEAADLVDDDQLVIAVQEKERRASLPG